MKSSTQVVANVNGYNIEKTVEGKSKFFAVVLNEVNRYGTEVKMVQHIANTLASAKKYAAKN